MRIRTGGNLTSELLRAYVGREDCCGESLRLGHCYFQVASVIASERSEDQVKRFLESYWRHDWETLRAFNSWNGLNDNLVAHVIKCPNGRGVLVAVLDPVDLYMNPYLMAKSALDETAMQHVASLLADAECLSLS